MNLKSCGGWLIRKYRWCEYNEIKNIGKQQLKAFITLVLFGFCSFDKENDVRTLGYVQIS